MSYKHQRKQLIFCQLLDNMGGLYQFKNLFQFFLFYQSEALY